jgi:hypothetical protein
MLGCLTSFTTLFFIYHYPFLNPSCDHHHELGGNEQCFSFYRHDSVIALDFTKHTTVSLSIE